MSNDFTLIKGYQQDDRLRASFDALSQRVFGLSFEPWYQMGCWRDNYIPYSFLAGERIVANVSVSPVRLLHRGETLKLYQLGTVMTDPIYRCQGLSRRLIEAIDQDFAGADGSFLFANDSVAEFYPRFGYEISQEFECTLLNRGGSSRRARNISLDDPKELDRFEAAVKASAVQQDPWMADSLGHVMFYVKERYSHDIWYLKDQQLYAVARIAGKELLLYGIFAPQPADPAEVADAFGSFWERAVLGFSPLSAAGCRLRPVTEPDSTFFIRGSALKFLEEDRLRLPVLIRT